MDTPELKQLYRRYQRYERFAKQYNAVLDERAGGRCARRSSIPWRRP